MLDVTHIEYTPRTSPLLAGEHAIHGAVAADSIDAWVAGHYGQPNQEQRALANGQAVVDLSHYGIVTITGADRLNLLHTLTTQNFQGLISPIDTEALFLDLRGRIEIAVKAHDDGETTYLITEPTMNASLVDWLTRMQFAARVEITDRTGELALLGATDEIPGLDTPCGSTPGRHCCRWLRLHPDPADHPAVHENYAWRLYILDADALVETVTNLPDGFRLAGTMASKLCASQRDVPDNWSIPTTVPSHTNSTGCVPQSTSTRDAIRDKKPWHAFTTWVTHLGASLGC